MTSCVSDFRCVTLCVSMSGLSPVTVTVSSTAPTRSSTLTAAVKSLVSSIPSRFTVLNPGSVNVTVYVPGRRSMILYCPSPLVTATRVFSMSAGLDASTVTPGITPPVLSRTPPALALGGANAAVAGSSGAQAAKTDAKPRPRAMYPPAARVYGFFSGDAAFVRPVPILIPASDETAAEPLHGASFTRSSLTVSGLQFRVRMGTSGRVLVVDDYEPNLSAMRRLLERAGYSVITAMNGHEALETINRERPDLVLLDVVMPEISGVDVCAAVKGTADTCLTPVVLVSGVQERATRIDAIGAGADDFPNKPIVRHHHERIDGRGYPDHLRGGQIPLLAQIVSVVDVFDALTTDRPYRKALSTDVAYEMMRDDAASGWCATALVEAFIDLHLSS